MGRSIVRRAGIVAIGTLASRILGAARDAVIAASFSLAATDAFFVAFTIPNALRMILAEGAVSSAFIPVFSEEKERHGWARAQEFYGRLMGTMLLLLALVSIVGVLAAPGIVRLYAAGYAQDAEKLALTVQLTQWLFPYILFMGLAALGMGALNTMGRFAVPAFAPALLNVCMLIAPWTLVPWFVDRGMPAIQGLAAAALVGGALQMLAQVPSLVCVGLWQRPRWGFGDPAVRKALGLLLPLLLGMGIYQINLLLSRLLASFLPDGSQSFLYYGQRVVEIPQGLFALALASATLPSLAALRNRGAHAEARATFAHSLRLSSFIAMPAALLIAVLAEPIASVLFGRGAFGAHQVAETARALFWMALGVWAVAAVRNVVQLYYAYNDTRTPVLCSGISLCVFVTSAVGLMPWMGHAGIAAANSLAAIAQLVGLLWRLRGRVGAYPLQDILTSAGRHLAAGLLMALAAGAVARWGAWSLGGNDPRNLLTLAGALVVAVLVYLVTSKLMRAPELEELTGALRRRSARSRGA